MAMDDRLASRFYENNLLVRTQNSQDRIALLEKLFVLNRLPETLSLNDILVGDGQGNWVTTSAAEFLSAFNLREKLTADRTYYVRTAPASVTISIASPGVVTWNSHGLAADAPISFCILEYPSAVTITIASPGVVTWNNHGRVANDPVIFQSTGALPTGLVQSTVYYVVAAGLTTNTFRVSATPGGAAINTSGTQSGTHEGLLTGTMPTGLSIGTIYYVVGASITANTFQVSATPGGAAINTTGSTAGYISAQTGSDSNSGLSASATDALLTLQGAVNFVRDYLDLGGFTVTIQLSDGTYTAGCEIAGPWAGYGSVVIKGNATYNANVRFDVDNVNHCFYIHHNAKVTIQDLRIRTVNNGDCISVWWGAFVSISNIRFSSCAANHLRASDNATVSVDGNYIIQAAATQHWNILLGASLRCQSRTITIYTTPAFTIFSLLSRASSCLVNAITFSGGATGQRYNVSLNGVLDTNGGGASYLPGNSAGATAIGGQYN